jgi:hypothetical protein
MLNKTRNFAYNGTVDSAVLMGAGIALDAVALPAAPETLGTSEAPGTILFAAGEKSAETFTIIDWAAAGAQWVLSDGNHEAGQDVVDNAQDQVASKVADRQGFGSGYSFASGIASVLGGPPKPGTCSGP